MKFVNGSRLAIYPSEGLTGYWYVELPDFEEMTFLSGFLNPGTIFYDVSANAGAYAVFAASHGCRVFAFEPVPHTFKRLEENATLNLPALSVTPINKAVGSTSRVIQITTELGTANHVVTGSDSNPCADVDCTTLDEFCSTNPSPQFIKLDVEGHELEVLKGSEKVLANPELIGLLIETFRPSNWHLPNHRELERILRSHGFFPYNSSSAVPREMTRADEGGDNTFYLRTRDFVQTNSRRTGISIF